MKSGEGQCDEYGGKLNGNESGLVEQLIWDKAYAWLSDHDFSIPHAHRPPASFRGIECELLTLSR